jgi:hypothetical protein
MHGCKTPHDGAMARHRMMLADWRRVSGRSRAQTLPFAGRSVHQHPRAVSAEPSRELSSVARMDYEGAGAMPAQALLR